MLDKNKIWVYKKVIIKIFSVKIFVKYIFYINFLFYNFKILNDLKGFIDEYDVRL